MNQRILFKFCLPALLLSMLAIGCQKSGPPAEPPTKIKLAGHPMQFSPPSKYEAKELKDAENKVRSISYVTPSGGGHIAVFLDDRTSKYKQLDAPTLEQFAEAVYKRKGRFTKQEEVKVGSDPGYRMEYEYGEGETKMRGAQVHLIHKERLYSIVMLSPYKEWDAMLGQFDNLVKTFQPLD